MSTCFCCSTIGTHEVEIKLPNGEIIIKHLCEKHNALHTTGKMLKVEKSKAKYCCGVPIRNGRCQISGKLFEDC